MADDSNAITFTTNQLANILGLSPRRVQQLAEDGVLVRSKKGRYLAAESVQNFIRSIQTKEGKAEVDYFEERAKHERAKRERAELNLAVMKGTLHRAEDVEYVMDDMLAAFKTKILALPSKIAPQLVGKTEQGEILDLMYRDVAEALTELSEYDGFLFNGKNETYIGEVGADERIVDE